MSLRTIFAGTFLGLALAACTTAPRSEAGRVGTAGANLATAISVQSGTVAKEAASDAAIELFYLAYIECKDAPPSDVCPAPRTPADTAAEQRATAAMRTHAKYLRGEAAAFAATANAYSALKTETDYDASADASDAIGGAAKAVTAFAITVLPAASLLPIDDLIRQASDQVAARRQKERLLSANARLRAVSKILLHVETERLAIVQSSIEELHDHRERTMQALIDEGVVNRAELFGKLMKLSDIPVASDASKKIDASKLLQSSVDVALKQDAADRLEDRLQKSALPIEALNALIAVHDQFEATGQANTSLVERMTARLAADPAPPTDAPPAAAPASPATPATPAPSAPGAPSAATPTKTKSN